MIAVMSPEDSWVSKWQRISNNYLNLIKFYMIYIVVNIINYLLIFRQIKKRYLCNISVWKTETT